MAPVDNSDFLEIFEIDVPSYPYSIMHSNAAIIILSRVRELFFCCHRLAGTLLNFAIAHFLGSSSFSVYIT